MKLLPIDQLVLAANVIRFLTIVVGSALFKFCFWTTSAKMQIMSRLLK